MSRYKKERIGGWTWVLPILLCIIACGFATVANLYPKIDMYRYCSNFFGYVYFCGSYTEGVKKKRIFFSTCTVRDMRVRLTKLVVVYVLTITHT